MRIVVVIALALCLFCAAAFGQRAGGVAPDAQRVRKGDRLLVTRKLERVRFEAAYGYKTMEITHTNEAYPQVFYQREGEKNVLITHTNGSFTEIPAGVVVEVFSEPRDGAERIEVVPVRAGSVKDPGELRKMFLEDRYISRDFLYYTILLDARDLGTALVPVGSAAASAQQPPAADLKTSPLHRSVPGEWVFEEKSFISINSEAVDPNDVAVTRKVFAFGRDGSVTLVESKRGQSSEYLKEDWLFRSYGTYSYSGDTIKIFITRFAAERYMLEKYNVADGKWVRESFPTYDSLITDGSQDRWIMFRDLSEDFRKRQ